MIRRCAAILAVAGICVSGCAVQGTPFDKVPAPPENVVIYVYRPYHYGSSLLRPAVTCGDDSARIGPGGYHAFVVPANSGEVTCSVQGAESSDAVALEPHTRVYYIREEFVWGLLSGHPHLNPVDADRANSEIQTCCVDESASNRP